MLPVPSLPAAKRAVKILHMDKTQKELAFIRDLFVDEEWTRRFTELADKHIDLRDAENLLYINSGTGTHCIELRTRADDDLAIFAACEDEHMLNIARDKAIATRADVDFSMIQFEDDAFDVVVADASFTPPIDLPEFLRDATRVAQSGGKLRSCFRPPERLVKYSHYFGKYSLTPN